MNGLEKGWGSMRIGDREFDLKQHTYVCGILNVTPDSFSDGGKYQEKDQMLRRVETMLTQGMDLLDVGGESTRPGYRKISAEEEMERVLPVIQAVKERFCVPVSLDTYKASVAAEGIRAGADLINDIWGLKADPKMAEVIAGSGVACCLMHNREEALYGDLMQDMRSDLEESLRLAENAGIAREKILLDPGVGFGKTYEDNLTVLARMEELHKLGLPILLGASRKSVIGLTLNLPVDQREEGTLVTTVMAVLKGISFVRVHDVEKSVRAIKMAEAIWERSIR